MIEAGGSWNFELWGAKFKCNDWSQSPAVVCDRQEHAPRQSANKISTDGLGLWIYWHHRRALSIALTVKLTEGLRNGGWQIFRVVSRVKVEPRDCEQVIDRDAKVSIFSLNSGTRRARCISRNENSS
ncbi:hypothetical protein WN55_09842 [Dufourea novaeangliae]|uniref:Uncharacterized protein n=1 Tax=Dufourea novaeangliae TaxID=178035 RepID=A0A154P7E0_DUFNO|nr:hypothetical protein WN55_09842 [Dufourea novaeangliae]